VTLLQWGRAGLQQGHPAAVGREEGHPAAVRRGLRLAFGL